MNRARCPSGSQSCRFGGRISSWKGSYGRYVLKAATATPRLDFSSSNWMWLQRFLSVAKRLQRCSPLSTHWLTGSGYSDPTLMPSERHEDRVCYILEKPPPPSPSHSSRFTATGTSPCGRELSNSLSSVTVSPKGFRSMKHTASQLSFSARPYPFPPTSQKDDRGSTPGSFFTTCQSRMGHWLNWKLTWKSPGASAIFRTSKPTHSSTHVRSWGE